MTTDKKLVLGMALIDGYGGLHGAWRAPHVDPGTYADVNATVRHARAAERGKFAFLFTPDFPAVRGDVEHSTISNLMDPLIELTAVARETTNIGFVATGSTTFQEPFNTARQFKRDQYAAQWLAAAVYLAAAEEALRGETWSG